MIFMQYKILFLINYSNRVKERSKVNHRVSNIEGLRFSFFNLRFEIHNLKSIKECPQSSNLSGYSSLGAFSEGLLSGSSFCPRPRVHQKIFSEVYPASG